MSDQKKFFGYIRISYNSISQKEQEKQIIKAFEYYKEKYINYSCSLQIITADTLNKGVKNNLHNYVGNYINEGDHVIIASFDIIALSFEEIYGILGYLKKNKINIHIINIDFFSEESGYEDLIKLVSKLELFHLKTLKELQHEGRLKAKSQGKYLGRKPIAGAKKSEVLDLIKKGEYSTEEIAIKVGISPSTVRRIKKQEKMERPQKQ